VLFLILCYGLLISLTSPHYGALTEGSDRTTPFGYGLLVVVKMTEMIMMIIMYRRPETDRGLQVIGEKAYYPALAIFFNVKWGTGEIQEGRCVATARRSGSLGVASFINSPFLVSFAE
jgi:hypothetical protein